MRHTVFIPIVALFLGVWSATPLRTPAAPPSGTSVPPQPAAEAPAPQALFSSLQQALRAQRPHTLAYQIFDVGIYHLTYDPQSRWAVLLLEFRDPQSGQTLPTEPGLGMAYWDGAAWETFVPGDPRWQQTLLAMPGTLLDRQQKSLWQNLADTARPAAPAAAPFGGYLLPWEGGTVNRLTRSIAHGGREYYAFDFAAYTPGNMFPVYAAKGGTVKYVKWSYPNGYYDGNCNHANYIVLEDTSTSPTTYQLYLHLAQDSIPQELRTHGVYVQQGQYLGMADDTGCSTGHHLHFQVHTDAAWWSTSVDITFDDVPINGGRPRTPSEAAGSGEDGQIYYTSGNVVHNPDSTPPQGGLLSPFADGALVTTRTLTLEGWATDDLSGLNSVQFIANYTGTWQSISPNLAPALTFSYTWDLCAAGVPDGPLSLALALQDNAQNFGAPLSGLRQVFKRYTCPPPPTCQPGLRQVALFAQPNYQGACTVLGIGDYAQGDSLGTLGGGQAASVRLGSQALLTLFSQENFQGRSSTLSADDPNLADNPIGAGTTWSARVLPRQGTPRIPLPQWPPQGSTLPGTGDLYWQDAGGGVQFQVRLSGTQSFTSTWQPLPYLLPVLPQGTYTWTVRARNPLTSGISTTQWSAPYTFTLSNTLPLTPAISLPYTRDLETAGNWQALSWALSSEPAHDGLVWVISPTQHSLTEAYQADLTTPPISVTLPDYALTFWYRANTEGNGAHWDQRRLLISVDGAPFQTLQTFQDDPMLGWMQAPQADLTPYLGHTVRFRFHFATLDGAHNSLAPWAIDQVQLVPRQIYPCTESTPNDSPASATTLTFGQTYAGSICPPGDLDFFAFQGQAGQRISADVNAVGTGNGSQLDAYLFLLDEDGLSLLAEHDDEVPYQMQDPHLGFNLPYSGTYYLKLRAWDHPTAGGQTYTYTLRVITDTNAPSLTLHVPTPLVPGQAISLTASTSDNDGVQQVAFWWHSSDWAQDTWQLLAIDSDGRDGWQAPLNLVGLPPQAEMAFYAEATDWAGNRAYHGAWHMLYGKAIYLPIMLK